MIDNPVYDDNLVRGSDLQPIIDQMNAQEVFVDDLTMISTESTAGKYLSVIDQYGGGSGGGGEAGDTNVYPCIVTSVTDTALYGVKLENPTGSPFLIAPLSFQDTNLSVGNVIMATEYTAVTL